MQGYLRDWVPSTNEFDEAMKEAYEKMFKV